MPTNAPSNSQFTSFTPRFLPRGQKHLLEVFLAQTLPAAPGCLLRSNDAATLATFPS